MLRKLLIILSVPVLIACNESSSLNKAEQQLVTESVRQTLHNYCEATKGAGLSAELPYLDSSDEFFWVPPGYSSAISYDSVVTFVRQNAPRFSRINNRWNSLRIIPLSKELATYTGILHSAMTDTSGKTTSSSLIETGVMIKRKDGWKLLHGQTAVLPNL